MDRLSGMAIFARVVDAESFTTAAKQLGMSKSAVSKSIAALEDRLGARLLNRTTRRIGLTEIGRAFYVSSTRIVAEAEEAELAVTRLQAAPRGTLRINAPLSFGLRHLSPALTDFMSIHEDLNVEIDFNDRFVDLIEEGYDIAVRITDALPDSTLIARSISQSEALIVASPAYWARHGRPETPEDLRKHRCITYSNVSTPRDWPFGEKGKDRRTIRVKATLQTNNGDMALQAAIAGLGVARSPRFICGPMIANGALEPVLEDCRPKPLKIFALYPHNRHLSAKVRVFVDFLAQRFGPDCNWDRPLMGFVG